MKLLKFFILVIAIVSTIALEGLNPEEEKPADV